MKNITLAVLAVSALATPFSRATTAGLYDPYGRSGNPEVVSALWDTFNEVYASGSGSTTLYTYTGNSTGSPTFTGLSLTQNNPLTAAPGAGAGAQGRGLVEWDGSSSWVNLASNLGTSDAYYSSTAATSWTLNATTSIDIQTLSFQIKLNTASSDPGSGLTGITNNLYLPTLNGVGAAMYVRSQDSGTVYSTTPTARNFWVIEYQWTGLNIEAGDSLQIAFALAGGNSGAYTRRVVDFVALDGTSVPEPSVGALVGLGLGVSLLRRRRVAR